MNGPEKKIVFQVVQMTLACGVMKSLKPEEPLRINDKFFLGGPLSLRGFNIKGAGPESQGNSGRIFYFVGMSMEEVQAGAFVCPPLIMILFCIFTYQVFSSRQAGALGPLPGHGCGPST